VVPPTVSVTIRAFRSETRAAAKRARNSVFIRLGVKFQA
jgi:hypothetical protein